MDNQRTESTPCKCFRYGSEDHLIAKFPNPRKENEKRKKQFRFSERGNNELHQEYDNSDNNNDQQINASMPHMSDNDESPSRYFGNSSQLTNWILDSGETCHVNPQVSDFIPSLLEDTDKHIEFENEHHFTAKQKGQVRIKNLQQ